MRKSIAASAVLSIFFSVLLTLICCLLAHQLITIMKIPEDISKEAYDYMFVVYPRTKAALQAAADRGVRIVLASGRPTVGIEPLAKELELDRRGGCILSYNGGKIIDCKTGETLVQHEFPPELIDPVCTFARYWNVMPLTYDAKGIVTEDAANPYVGEEARINKIPARQVENLPAEIQWPINKLLLVGDPVDMPHVEELMQQKFAGKLSIYRSAPFFIETMPLGVEKSASLALLLKNMGLGPENLMACGDGWNDLPMIRHAGMGVAMGNAVPEVKQAAQYVTADNEHDGVGLAVEKFILVNNPGVRCMGDFWHMTWEETSDMGAFLSAGEYLQHVHVASRKRRSMPGEDGEADNYVNGFKGLKMLDYDKYVSFECGCQGDRNVLVPAAVELLRKQWEEA